MKIKTKKAKKKAGRRIGSKKADTSASDSPNLDAAGGDFFKLFEANKLLNNSITDIRKKLEEKKKREIEENKKKKKKEENEKYIRKSVEQAEKLYNHVRVYAANNADKYGSLPDQEKSNLFYDEYKEFHNEFTIVYKYIVCFGKYSTRAFIKYLKKTLSFVPDSQERFRNKNYMREKWIERQADYVRYLWEDSQEGNHFTRKESNKVWKEAYKYISEEFNHFEELYQTKEKEIKEKSNIHKYDLLKEATGRIRDGLQDVKDTTKQEMIEKFLDRLYRQRKLKLLKEFMCHYTPQEPNISGFGKNKDAQSEYEEELKQFEYKKKIEDFENKEKK
jgi:hypothetical protein